MERRLTALEWTQDLEDRQRERRSFVDQQPSRTSNDKRRSRPRKRSLSAEDPLQDDSEYAEHVSRSPCKVPLESLPFVLSEKARFYAPSRTQLLRDAETFQSYRIRSVARDAVDKWCFAAMEAKNRHEYMQRVAIAHDTEILWRQALEHWRLRLHERKQAVQTMRYFQHLERRATKARDLYLLTKAFTHWRQCARDEVLRVTLARQHILSVKYFNAWRDLTIANQDKVHDHGLRKYFGLWRRRYVQNVTNDIKAELAHQRYLMRSAYWHWFWGFCEARAPEWQARRLKQRTLMKWLITFRTNERRNQQVTIHIEIAAKRFFITKWLNKAKRILHNRDTAAAYNHQTLSAQAFRTWNRIHRHFPILQQVSNMVDWRIARATFAIFVNRFRQLKQAESLARLRVKRNAWTQWNDHLRWQTLARQIDDRCVLEVLYKWTIAERLKLSIRLFQERQKEKYLMMLRSIYTRRERQRNDGLRAIESQLTRRSLHLIISQWRVSCKMFQQNEQVAIKFHDPRIAYEAFNSLSRRSQDIEVLNKKASHAADYFVLKRSLDRWHAAFISSKRQKRRNAYIQIRRKSKMDLASAMLQRWQSATAMARKMDREAFQLDQDRILRIAADLFNRWSMSYDRVVDQHFYATNHFDEQLLVRLFRLWSHRTSDLTDSERTAFQHAHLHRQNTALICLNKLRLRLIELKGPQATAENLRMRYEKRHFYNMVRLWQEHTAHRLDKPTRNRVTLSAKSRRTKLLGRSDNRFGATARAEEWTELDQGEWPPQLEAQSGTISQPGFFNTPSKRAARTKAMIQESTTPSGTPFQTRLRAQLYTTPRTTQRALFGRMKDSKTTPLLEGSGSTTAVDRDE